MFGILNIFKPLGCTSHDVVAKIRRKFDIKRVGHGGTLDPLAEGVLPVCLGQATRLLEYFPDDKRYRAKMTFGIETTTWDGEGEHVAVRSARHLTRFMIDGILPQFTGKIQQIVPARSAVHVGGRKLYEYAHKGIEVELPSREASIFSLDVVDITDLETDHPVVTFDIHCGSGTYIRSIAYEMGQALGVGGYLSGLVRTGHGLFTSEDAIPLETLLDSKHPALYLQNPALYLPFPQCPIQPESLEKIRHGMKLNADEISERVVNDRHYVLLYRDVPVAIVTGESTKRLKPVKVFLSEIPESEAPEPTPLFPS